MCGGGAEGWGWKRWMVVKCGSTTVKDTPYFVN